MSDIQSEKWSNETVEAVSEILARDSPFEMGLSDRPKKVEFYRTVIQCAIDRVVAAAQEPERSVYCIAGEPVSIAVGKEFGQLIAERDKLLDQLAASQKSCKMGLCEGAALFANKALTFKEQLAAAQSDTHPPGMSLNELNSNYENMQQDLFPPPQHRTPGQLIQELLESRKWTQRTLAIVLDVSETMISKIITGSQSLTAELALGISEIFGVPAEHLMHLQKSYELAQARIVARPDPERQNRAILFGALPIAEMIRRGWLPGAEDILNVAVVEAKLAKFFGVKSPSEIEIIPHAAKRTHVASDVTPAQLVWLYRVKQIAADMLAPRYSPEAIRAAIPKLRSLLQSPEEARRVPRILTECGIRYVIVETLPGANIDGVCFWLNDKPVIGMSFRRDTIDNFWFVLRHELEHVLRLHGKESIPLDIDLEGERAGVGANLSKEERAANEAAAEFCVPTKSLEALIARKAPFFYERDLVGFARSLQIHPGLVAGQLHHRFGRPERFRKHLAKVRKIVAPNAAVDGWGDIYPLD